MPISNLRTLSFWDVAPQVADYPKKKLAGNEHTPHSRNVQRPLKGLMFAVRRTEDIASPEAIP